MTARSPDEPHRVSTQLELLFDLTFVIAIATVTGHFNHAIGEGHALSELVPFLQIFFAIWWAWVNFTWFASAFDCDDVPFRLLTLMQMAGVLVLASGVAAALDHNDYRAVTLGYLIMRVGLLAQWVRVAVEDPASRATAVRYATGITIAEVAWLSRLGIADAGWVSDTWLLAIFVALVAFELAIPVWAERGRPSNRHPHHLAERYGLFVIIVLGESVFAAATGVREALAADGVSAPLVTVGGAGLVLVFALWWLYFLQPVGDGLAEHPDRAYLWGYGHYGIFAALAALGAGLEIAVEQTGGHVPTSPDVIAYAVAIPVAVFLALLWALHAPLITRLMLRPELMGGGVIAVLLLPLAASQVAVAAVVGAIAIVAALIVAITVALPRPAALTAPAHAERLALRERADPV